MESNETIQDCADRLWSAQVDRAPCAPLTDDLEIGPALAYAIQQHNIERRIAAGARRVGWKVGLTSDAIQSWLNVDEPDFGSLLDDMAVDDGGLADTARLLQPRAEGEVAFVLDRDLRGQVTSAEVLAATAFLLPAVEIIDSRVADWKIKWGDTVADNASSGMFVLGSTPVPVDEVDLRLCGMSLRKNGSIVSTGAGAACLGHPVNAVVWLARILGEMGQKLCAGDVVLSGALGPVTPVQSGDWLELDIDGLGTTSCRFR